MFASLRKYIEIVVLLTLGDRHPQIQVGDGKSSSRVTPGEAIKDDPDYLSSWKEGDSKTSSGPLSIYGCRIWMQLLPSFDNVCR